MEIQFFSVESNSMSTSFGKKLVTTKILKLVDNACFDEKKLNFILFISLFSGIAASGPGTPSFTREVKKPELLPQRSKLRIWDQIHGKAWGQRGRFNPPLLSPELPTFHPLSVKPLQFFTLSVKLPSHRIVTSTMPHT